MVERPRFVMNQREFEPCHCSNPCLAEEYARQDGERLLDPTDCMNEIVYDCIDTSPYYENMMEFYIDESQAIDLPPVDNQLDSKKYPYGPAAPST